MNNKHIKKCSTSLFIIGNPPENPERYYNMFSRLAKIKSLSPNTAYAMELLGLPM